jgi:glycosyltransferase involved in cell wall biosynthesis
MSVAPPRILLVGDLFSFPHGTGSTTRVLAVARGLRSAGAEVGVLVTRYQERDPATAANRDASGMFEGIPFAYTTGTSMRPARFVQRRLSPARGVAGAAREILSLTGGRADAAILFTGHTYALPLSAWLATRLRGSALLFDGCEKPFVYEQESAARRFEERIYTPLGYRGYDGIFAISDYLAEYFARRGGPGTRIMQVPILVDVDRFTPPRARTAPSCRYVAYSGKLSAAKGVDVLVRAFAAVADEFPGMRLRLSGGSGPASYQDMLVGLTKELAIADRVDFCGTIPYGEFPGFLTGAEILVVPHAQGEFSEAAFPTKLGEYLASGTPTIATDVGEIGRYVRDGVDLYLVPPDDVTALSERLRRMLRDPAQARAVGSHGRTAARRHFDYRLHGERLFLFIDGLRGRGQFGAATGRLVMD